MPAKKETIALQKELLNQEQWDEIMSLEGLTVVDVYQKWCGPCAAMVSLFRRLRNEVGDDLLRFAVAEADGVETLERYRGKCEPCFLFFGTGQLVRVVRGADAPAILKYVEAELKQEHKVLEEGLDRAVIKDPMLAAFEAEEQQAAQEEEQEKMRQEEEARKPVPKEVTVVLIKPDAVKNGHVDNIIANVVEHGFEIVTQEERTLTEEEAREFYKQHAEEEHFEELVTFMASGPSRILVLTRGDTGEGVVSEIRDLLGPKDVEVAKEEAPDSLRAQYGTDKCMNAMHGADSRETAARELAFLLPKFQVPIVPGTGPPPAIEKTLALIRPSALKDHKDEMIQKIQEAGFEVCLQKYVQLTEDQAKDFYREQEGTPHFEDLIREMTSGEVLALGLAKESAIQSWREFIGPTTIDQAKEEAPESLRAQYTIPEKEINVVHGSDSQDTAEKELEFFFPKQTTLAVIKPDAVAEHKDAIIEKIKEAGFSISLQRDVELNKDLASKLYSEHEGKEFYEGLIDHMSTGLSMVMLLSREDAVDGWRTLMGPTDPDQARETAPESLRALLGKDVLQNAVHGASNPEQAKERVERLFPDIEVLSTGEVKDSVASMATEDVKEGEAPAEEEEAPAEGGDQQAEQPAEGEGEQQAEQPAAEGEQATEAAAEGGEQQTEEPAVEGEQKAEEPAAEGGEQTAAEGGETPAEEGGEAEQAQEGGDEKPAEEVTPPSDDAPAAEQAPAEAEGGGEEEEKKEEEGQEAQQTQDEPAAEAAPAEGEEAAPAEGEAAPAEGGGAEEPKPEGGEEEVQQTAE